MSRFVYVDSLYTDSEGFFFFTAEWEKKPTIYQFPVSFKNLKTFFQLINFESIVILFWCLYRITPLKN